MIKEGISRTIDPRVVPLWAAHIDGGVPPQFLSATFGSDFMYDPATVSATAYLVRMMKLISPTEYRALLGSEATRVVDLTQRLAKPIADLDQPHGLNRMEFMFGIPGNIAGGIGKNQKSTPIGALSSPFDDSRQAAVSATLTARPDGSIEVQPSVFFVVMDTVDFCPGFCGGPPAQVATIPLSRFEATGISGDVPFVVIFYAPASAQPPFTVKA